jgi:hypothetical protein
MSLRLELQHLSNPQRGVVATFLKQFQQTWTEGKLNSWIPKLPLTGSPLRTPVLAGMIQIDLGNRWRQGGEAAVESYLQRFPELGTPGTVAPALIWAEYQARQQTGQPVRLSELATRFSRSEADLERLFRGYASQPAPSPVRSASVAELFAEPVTAILPRTGKEPIRPSGPGHIPAVIVEENDEDFKETRAFVPEPAKVPVPATPGKTEGFQVGRPPSPIIPPPATGPSSDARERVSVVKRSESRRQAPWLWIMAGTAAVLLVTGVLVVGWQFFGPSAPPTPAENPIASTGEKQEEKPAENCPVPVVPNPVIKPKENPELRPVTENPKKSVDQENDARLAKSFSLENLKIGKQPARVGDPIVFSFEVVNRSGQELMIPVKNQFHVFGTQQVWIERMGMDSKIPVMPPRVAYYKGRYAQGGSDILARPVVVKGESFRFNRTINTDGFPPGSYRVHVEFKDRNHTVVQTVHADVELKTVEKAKVENQPGTAPNQDAKQKQALAELRKLDAKLEFRGNDLIGVSFFKAKDKATDKLLEHLKNLSSLETLNLFESPVSDNGLVHVAELKNLKVLVVKSDKVTNQGLKHLRGLTKLTNLVLYGSQVNDETLPYLAGLTELQYLNFYNTKISDKGLVHLQGLPKLQQLYVFGTGVTIQGARNLEGVMPNLKVIGR